VLIVGDPEGWVGTGSGSAGLCEGRGEVRGKTAQSYPPPPRRFNTSAPSTDGSKRSSVEHMEIDTLGYTKYLEEHGVPRAEAEKHARELRRFLLPDDPTLEARVAKLESWVNRLERGCEQILKKPGS
jgi:hypothetical protein